MDCPACGYSRQTTDEHLHPDLCPHCGIAYHKYSPPTDPPTTGSTANKAQHDRFTVEPHQALWRRGLSHFLEPPNTNALPKDYDTGYFLLYLALGVWGGYFLFGGVNAERVMGSFLHNIWLPFHEFGHVLFSPFGNTLMILGGSLFQVILPWFFIGLFSFQQQNNLSASAVLWWAGQSWVDVAPYIQDAPFRALPLIGGMNESAHDWGNLLEKWNKIAWANTLAHISFFIGIGLMALSLAWGFWLLRKRKNQYD